MKVKAARPMLQRLRYHLRYHLRYQLRYTERLRASGGFLEK